MHCVCFCVYFFFFVYLFIIFPAFDSVFVVDVAVVVVVVFFSRHLLLFVLFYSFSIQNICLHCSLYARCYNTVKKMFK